jgi:dihydrofolate synthase / folylpolyglutamate synthase
MSTISKQPSSFSSSITLGKQRNYHEIIELLDKNWTVADPKKSLERMKKLDNALGSPSKDLNTIFVTGTNGKSLTIHFITKLLKEEGFSVGAYYSPHVLIYNERIVLNTETINNKVFTDLANEVLSAAQSAHIEVSSQEILAAMALLYFKQSNIDVVVLEVSQGQYDPVTICAPKVVAVTRVTDEEDSDKISNKLKDLIKEMTEVATKDSWVVSADQSKLNLHLMSTIVKDLGAQWAMPIRKLAPLTYPFEQLHGRCAALAERVSQLYVEKCIAKEATIISTSLLTKPRGQRGRPTLEAKRQLELNPKRTLEQFWKEEASTLPARFQLLDKEKPTILLDNANNIDALKNLLLGIRLLHYQRPLKGLALIVGCHKTMYVEEFLKLIRYFFKKTSGNIILCPIADVIPGPIAQESWDVEKITNEIKNLKIKARAAKDFKEAFEYAKKSVDERNGLVVVTGSTAIVNEYWNYKGIKKL